MLIWSTYLVSFLWNKLRMYVECLKIFLLINMYLVELGFETENSTKEIFGLLSEMTEHELDWKKSFYSHSFFQSVLIGWNWKWFSNYV